MQTSQTKIIDDDRELPGDLLDDYSGRNLAYERYQRHHEYLEIVFSPDNISSLARPVLYENVTSEKIALVTQQQVITRNL